MLIGVADFCYWAAMYLYVPILPVYAQSLGANLSMVGIIVAAYAFPQVLLRIPIGIWSDRLGKRKPLFIIGTLIVFMASVGLGLATNPWMIVLARTAVGIGAAIWVVITVYFVSFFPSNDTSGPVGIINFVNGAGIMVASLAGGIITDNWDAGLAFNVAAVLGIIAFAALIFTEESNEPQFPGVSWRGIIQIASRRRLVVVSIMGMLLFFAQFAGIWGFIPVYAHGIGASDTALGVISMIAMGAFMVGTLIASSLAKSLGYSYTIILASMLLGLALIVTPFVSTVPMLEIVQFINGLGIGILTAALMSLSIYNISPQQRGTSMGFFQAAYSTGMLLGPLVSGYIAESHGLTWVFYISGMVSLLIAVMASMPIIPRHKQKLK